MRSTQRIALLLVLVFFIPVMFFSLYELSSLDEDEKMIANIYDKQLESILFSVNQYSDDIITNWAAKSETALQTSVNDSVPPKIQELIDLNSSLIGVIVFDTLKGAPITKGFFQPGFANGESVRNATVSALATNPESIRQLTGYKKNGFQKIEQLAGMDTSADVPAKALLFIAQNGYRLTPIVLVIDGQLFIDDIIGPRLQTISRDQFVLSVLRKGNDSILYSTATQRDTLAETSAITKDFWIFPEYSIGIYSAGEGIEKLIAERTKFNVILLAGLVVVLTIAMVLVFRSLKKEVDLAQNKADFVSNVSHEIRTPLALISMFSETLEMNRVPSEEKKQEYYRILSKETQRLTRIVNKILNFSQAEAKKKKLRIERLNMKQEIHGVLDVYDYHLRSKGFTYSFDCPDTLWLRADRESLIESFINLLDNAIKYSEEAKVITITAGSREGFAYLSVKDSGVGISKRTRSTSSTSFTAYPKATWRGRAAPALAWPSSDN
jgi:two-component system, OmpR family, phosphate regulon sensor histidine kinase PhoR